MRSDDHLPLDRGDGLRRGDSGRFEMPFRANYELDRAMTSLPRRCRLVMHLRWREGMTYADIAEVTGTSVNGIESELSGGIRSLRRAFGDGSEGLDWQILDRFLTTEATAAEVEEVHAWMDGAAARRAMVQALQSDAASRPDVAVDAAWRRLSGQSVRQLKTEWWRSATWITAAMLVLALGFTITLVLLRDSGAARQLATAWRETTAPLGRRVTVTLPDGTRVVLNAGSTLRYPYPFELGKRQVVLHGEAYFTAQHDAARPFHVRANNVDVADIGTRFVVRAYDSSPATMVVVVDGSAAVTVGRRDTVVVEPGALARVTSSGAIRTSTVDPERFTGFTTGLLVLADLRLVDAIPVIERWYDVRIRMTDPVIGTRQLAANFRDEPLTGVLDALSRALDVDIRRDGRNVTISPRSK
jgi:ferric-dicitrate binding protein FerR (iron transport regulator)